MIPRRVSAPALLVVLALSIVTASKSSAAWPHHPSVNLPVFTGTDAQYSPAMVSDGAGGAFVTWYESRGGGDYNVYAQHVLASGTADPAWPVNGLAVCTAALDQASPAIVADGSGGAIVAWYDLRGGSGGDIYAQRVRSTGVVDPAWPVNGRALCTAGDNQLYPAITSDGAGGAIVSWSDLRTSIDTDVYVQRVLSTGVVDAAWPANGRALCTASGSQNFPFLVADGAGGAIVTWTDNRNSNNDLYAHHVLSTGVADASWTFNGSAVCVQPNDQWNPSIVADGAGGAIVTWNDFRNGSHNDIYAQHVRSVGGVDPNWPANGRLLCGAANPQWNPIAVSDGAGGAVVAWQDYRSGLNFDVYAQHVLPTGAVDAAWPADGRALCTAAYNQHETTVVPDGAGGAIVSWSDAREGNGTFDLYAQHVFSSGAVDPLWPANGRALSTAGGDQQTPIGASDGAGGAIVLWVDTRSGNSDLYAQRIARFGVPGTPEGEIVGVSDVPNDQGGRVKLSWYASWVDTDVEPFSGIHEVDLYEVWRSVPAGAATAASLRGSRVFADFSRAPAGDTRTIVIMPAGAQVYAWEYLATQNATHYIPAYSYLAATAGDSTGAYNPVTAYMVVARNTSGSKYWLSQPESGYSADNLAPAVPAPFSGHYSGGATHLHWNPNLEPDLANYQLYRGSSASFVPGPPNLIASPPDTGHVDVGTAGGYYKLSAVDLHGNESGFALLTPTLTGGVGGGGSLALALARPSPNPASETALLSYTLARESRVSLAIFDLAGRRVRRLVDEMRPAGDHALSWNLRSDAGSRLRGGLYFVRLEADQHALTQRLTIAQ